MQFTRTRCKTQTHTAFIGSDTGRVDIPVADLQDSYLLTSLHECAFTYAREINTWEIHVYSLCNYNYNH